MNELPVPPHFNPERVNEVWRVRYQKRADEAKAWAAMGTDGAGGPVVDWRVPVEEYPRYTYQAGDVLVWDWTNPNAGTMRWAIEMGLADATIRQG